MSDRIKKILAQMSRKEREQIIDLIETILQRRFSGLDMKKLKGHGSAYRVRKGDFRIIFTMSVDHEIRIVALERRTDTTYRGS